MVTDLRNALRDAVDPVPAAGVDLGQVVATGRQRVHRRRVTAVACVAAATAVVIALATVPGRLGGDDAVEPAEPVRLDLDTARHLDPEVLASARTLWLHPDTDLDFDRLLGLTDDGLVLRSRYTYEGDVSELGLVDPGTGRTSWLPNPPWDVGEPQPLAMDEDRLVLWDNRHANFNSVLTYDRATATWSRVTVPRAAFADAQGYGSLPLVPGIQTVAGPDGRVYAPDPLVSALRWWSAPIDEGGIPDSEPELEGRSLGWAGTTRLTADWTGRVVATTGDEQRVLAPGLPEGCQEVDKPVGPTPPLLAGSPDWAVVTFACAAGSTTVGYPLEGGATVAVADARVVAAGGHEALLTDGRRTYLLDLEQEQLTDIGPAPHEGGGAVTDDLVLWNVPGHLDDDDVYDVSYSVARIP